MAIVQSEERPSKIRRLDLAVNNGLSADHKFNEDVGPIMTEADEAVAATESDPAKTLFSNHSESRSSLGGNVDGEKLETKASQSLSKSQLKKLLKKQNWEEGREDRKAKRREKGKQKKARKAEARATADLQSAEDGLSAPDLPKTNSQRPVQLPITFVLDCDFDDFMTEAELISLGAQLTRCYSDNKSAPFRAHIVVSSFGGKLKQRFETVLASNHLGWKGVKFTGNDFVTAAIEADAVMRSPQGGQFAGAFAGMTTQGIQVVEQSLSSSMGQLQSSALASVEKPPSINYPSDETCSGAEQSAINSKTVASVVEVDAEVGSLTANKFIDMSDVVSTEKSNEDTSSQTFNSSHVPSVVYLTSDSPYTLDMLSPRTTYVIGGIVDKNRHKGICYKRAMARDIPTAKLPIGEYMTMQSRSVLATNHVAEIMLKWLECGDWAKAFLQVIPKRKEARLKLKQDVDEGSQEKRDGKASSSSKGG